MSLVVVAYPEIKKEDFSWIQSVRGEEDQLYFDIVAPHFTIVFPTENIEADNLTKELEKSFRNSTLINVSLTSAKIDKDAFNDYWHAFLIPSDGYEEVTKLHDIAYSGILQPELRTDIPYIPHIGIGNNKSSDHIVALVDSLNRIDLHIQGTITRVEIASFNGDEIKTLNTIKLK